MKRDLTFIITEEDSGLRIEQFLRQLGCSHHVLTQLKKTDHGIELNNVWAYTNQLLNTGDILTIHIVDLEASEQIVPVPLPLSIVYEDVDLMVIDKPADMPIHPSMGNYENTLANAVQYYFTSQGETFVYRCINRLDRDTSGLLILAKNALSGAILSGMSTRREIHREYLAITEGHLPASGTIDAPIARAEGSTIMRCVDYKHGETAVTHFTCLKQTETLSLASIRLETGRTHQIRVHMKHIGHPLIGDFLYNPEAMDLIRRQTLHSHKLEFLHPITKVPMQFTSPLPEDMEHVLTL